MNGCVAKLSTDLTPKSPQILLSQNPPYQLSLPLWISCSPCSRILADFENQNVQVHGIYLNVVYPTLFSLPLQCFFFQNQHNQLCINNGVKSKNGPSLTQQCQYWIFLKATFITIYT